MSWDGVTTGLPSLGSRCASAAASRYELLLELFLKVAMDTFSHRRSLVMCFSKTAAKAVSYHQSRLAQKASDTKRRRVGARFKRTAFLITSSRSWSLHAFISTFYQTFRSFQCSAWYRKRFFTHHEWFKELIAIFTWHNCCIGTS